MTSYNIYPTVPEDPQVDADCHLGVIQSKLKLEERYKKKYKKYTKTLNRLLTLNACTSGLSVATGISSVATWSTFFGLPVSNSLGAVSLAGASVSGVTTALTKKYQKKLTKVTTLTDTITSATAVLAKFNVLQTFHLKTMNGLTGVDRKMKAENRNQFEKSLLEEINDTKKTLGTRV